MEDNKLYALVWKLAALVICTLFLSVAGYNGYETYRVTEAKDPVSAKCAIGGERSSQACLTLLGRR